MTGRSGDADVAPLFEAATGIPGALETVPEPRVFLFVAGIAVLVIAAVDLLWTTLWVDGGNGPVSSQLTSVMWRALRAVGGGRSRALSLAGPIILVATLMAWVGLIWAGWTLVFAGAEGALLPAHDDVPVTWTGRLFFVAYSMFTMGNGDFYPPAGGWQIAAALTTANGMLFVTMGVSYVLSVLNAVSDKRSFASGVTGLGAGGEELVLSGWNGTDFEGLELPLDGFATELDRLADQHESYPILHYYHSQKPRQASAMAVAVLDEALTVLRYGVPEERRPAPPAVENARAASQTYLDTLDAAFIEPADEQPPPPDLDQLRNGGVPTVSDREFEAAMEELGERRCKLLGVVRADAWRWPRIEP